MKATHPVTSRNIHGFVLLVQSPPRSRLRVSLDAYVAPEVQAVVLVVVRGANNRARVDHCGHSMPDVERSEAERNRCHTIKPVK